VSGDADPVSADRLSPGSRLGPYEILKLIGAGGMGEVYRSRDTRLKREVAIKVLPASFLDDRKRLLRFEQEARSAGGLDHANVLAVYDVGSDAGRPYIVSQLLEGETLRNRLARGPLPARRAVDYAVQIAAGLAAAHGKGIVHRDLKPDNVFVTKDGHVKILDFGLAKLMETEREGEGGSTVSEAGTVLGTLGYMPPEQVAGAPADRRSDVFAFGAILYEMLVGNPAFAGNTRAEILNRILNEDPPGLRRNDARIPAALMGIAARCLEKEPAHRFESIKDVGYALNAYSMSSSEESSASVAASGARHRSTLVAGAALAVALLVGVAAGRFFSRGSAAEPPRFHRLTFRRGEVADARFAPDGQVIVYGARWEGRPFQLFSTRVGSAESMPLAFPSARILAISSTGKMALALCPDVACDVQTLADVSLSGGTPREILQAPFLFADWSPDGSDLAVVRQGEEESTLELPAGKVLLRAASLQGVRFSPDGRYLAAAKSISGRLPPDTIVIVGRDGKAATLSGPWRTVINFAWHPVTGEVWFTAQENDEADLSLQAVSPSGRHRVVARAPANLEIHDILRDGRVLLARDEIIEPLRLLSPSKPGDTDLSWLDLSSCADVAEDGGLVLFNELTQINAPGPATFIRKTDGSAAVRIGEGNGAALSPDSKSALVISGDGKQLSVVPTGVGEKRQLGTAGLRYTGARWSPDGRRVVFAASAGAGAPRLWVQEIDGRPPRAIGPDGLEAGPVSPDGRLVAARSGPEVVLVPMDGGELVRVPGRHDDDVVIRWDSTGRSLFVAHGRRPVRIERLEVATGRREPWRQIENADPGQIRMTADGRTIVYSEPVQYFSTLYVAEGLR
jgi:eukaryotic-like serine/threonine-protein kinase